MDFCGCIILPMFKQKCLDLQINSTLLANGCKEGFLFVFAKHFYGGSSIAVCVFSQFNGERAGT